MCGALGTTRWTLNNQEVASVADLCAEHSAPLQAVVDLVGTKLPVEQDNEWEAPAQVQRIPRKRSFQPLSWTPPES